MFAMGTRKGKPAKEGSHIRHHQWWSSQVLFTASIQRKTCIVFTKIQDEVVSVNLALKYIHI